MESDNILERQPESIRREARILGIPVRQFLIYLAVGGTAAAVGAIAAWQITRSSLGAAEKTTPQVLKPVPDEFFIRRGGDYETRLEKLIDRGYLTPNWLFYVRNHAPTPIVDVKTWRLHVRGKGIEKTLDLTYDELLKLPSKTETRFLECAGNGRAFYDIFHNRPARGGQWHLGAFGIAEWTGVPLSEILSRAGLRRTAVDVLVNSLDDKNVGRPIPVSKALEDDTILAYHMNGEVLPRDHGFPLRLIAPGWAGIANIKWVGEIIVSEQHQYNQWNTTDYVLTGPDYLPEVPAEGKIITYVPVKSALMLPWPATLSAGRQVVYGYAWSPFGKIARVEVSLNGGKTYRDAILTGPNIERAGTRWEFSFTATPGELSITPCATDEKNNREYDISEQRFNQLGYLYGAVVPHPVTVKP